jgi:hypothetical protein
MPELLNKYENRIKDFLYKMAQSPMVIKDHNIAISSTRKELLEEENHKILAGKGFVLKKFKTEKQRLQERMNIRDAVELGEDLLKMIPYGENISNISQISNNVNKTMLKLKAFYESKKEQFKAPNIKQPNMRFTAKNNLERIFDALNIYSYGRLDKDELEKQKKLMDLRKKRRDDGSDDDDDDDNSENLEIIENEESEKSNNKNSKKHPKNMHKSEDKKLMMKHARNLQARQIMSDLHERTHFKGAAGYTLWKNTSVLNHDFLNNQERHTANNTSKSSKNISWEKFQLKRLNSMILDAGDKNSNYNYVNNLNIQKVDFDKNLAKDSSSSVKYIPNISNNLRRESRNTGFETTNGYRENTNKFEDYINITNDSLNNNYLLTKLDIEEEMAQNNPLLYNLTFNNFKKKYENINQTDAKNLNYIKKIAFEAPNFSKREDNGDKKKYLKKLFKKKGERDIDKKKSLLHNDPIAFFEKFKENEEGVDNPKNMESRIFFNYFRKIKN